MFRQAEIEKHLSDRELALLKSGAFNPSGRLAALSHVAVCEKCARRLAEAYEADEGALTDPPASFLEDTLYKMGAGADAGTSKKRYYFYCLRVGLAACASIALVFSGVLGRIPDGFRTLPPASGGLVYTQRLADDIRTFSDNLIHLEVLKNDQ